MNSTASIVLRCILAVALVTGGLPALGSGGIDFEESESAPMKVDMNDGGMAESDEDCMDHGADDETASSSSECTADSGECCADDCVKSCTTLAMVPVTLDSESIGPTARRLNASAPIPASRVPETPLRPPQL